MNTTQKQREKQHARARQMNQLMKLRPRTAKQLHRFVEVLLDLRMPRRAMVAGNDSPFDYLVHSFLGSGEGSAKPQAAGGMRGSEIDENTSGDVVVWANRGGGKTMLGAVATLLDLVFKPGIEICILGGSFEQSSRMYTYLRTLFDRPVFRGVLASEPTQRRIELVNGSVATVLTQSPRSVRGQRVQRIRCDEVDVFDRKVWQAVQMVTRSKQCGDTFVHGAIDVMSTYHRPFGLMGDVIKNARQISTSCAHSGSPPSREGPGEGEGDDVQTGVKTTRQENRSSNPPLTPPCEGGGSEGKQRNSQRQRKSKSTRARLIRWCALDVIERCPPERDCDTCPLWDDCLGRAKFADGFMHIDDLIAQRQRTDNATWSAEMMCRRPTTSDSVFPMFDPTPGGRHVMQVGPGSLKHELVAAMRSEVKAFPEERLLRHVLIDAGSRTDDPPHQLVGGMDFGIRNPLVMLWARLRPRVPSDDLADVSDPTNPHNMIIEIVDEHVENGLTLDQNLVHIERKGWPKPDWLGVDPAGGQRSSQTGRSEIDLLRRRGYRVRKKRSVIPEGIKRIRRRLEQGTLRIAPQCEQLIRALASYHFDPDKPHSDRPVKDGHDHACDALRYLIVNLEVGGGVVAGRKY